MTDIYPDKDHITSYAPLFAEIIIPLALPKNYTWHIPYHLKDKAKAGCRVEVVLGKNKKYAGIIKRLHGNKPVAFEPKDILNVLDAEPIVFEQQMKLWEWIAQYYMCSEGEVMAAALPSYFKLSSETILMCNEEYGDDFSTLDNDEYIIAEALHIKKELRLTEVQQLLDASHVYPVIKRLIEKKICFVWEALKESYSAKKETYVVINPVYADDDALSGLMNNWGRAPKQLELLLSYLHLTKTEGEVTKPALLKKSGASDAQLKGLVEKNILWLEKRTVDRLRYLPLHINVDFSLTPAQQEVFEKLNGLFTEKQVCLLHGITSSGKTQIYIKLIEQYISQGKEVLYLLPEIALTSQIIRRLQKHFGGYIGIYHSKFNQNERIEIWNKIKTGELKIILGARSSLFLPFTNLGLIVVDEEHDTSFKQYDAAPRYNARDSAVYYATLFGSKVLLGSATPSLESYYNALQGKYGLVVLNERYGGVQLPAIEIIDTKQIVRKDKSKIILSPQLKKAMESALERDKQIILFQNRRGYSPYQICAVCGWIPQCKHCDVSLTYHKLSNKLVCHYCGTTYPNAATCAACGNHTFVQRNFGTEKIEEYLEENFTKARIARMDVDSVKGKHAHDSLIQLFEQKRIDILVGTQMVVKGLDFEHVSLVGILDADSILSFADFRVNERAFQLMEQVSGRAGRKKEQGRVMIQVVNTKHPVLHFVQQHDYAAFFRHEIEGRERFFYPPFSRIILITFRHKLKERTAEAAQYFALGLQKEFGKYIIGPAEPPVNRVRNQYLMELLLKIPKDTAFINKCKTAIQGQVVHLHQNKTFRSVVIIINVDAV
ncbi:replication restart helicase PriA [Agriterribacter sp.]|uniref:replication restart helicase PriA n=1 Tax=Agriterribacter sp. TaxID=2821509 RepID=UPI002BC840A3|nr:primosomal protein N' [Agriterribacter sp.]HTN07994.1 primosomal protein N' [Agriterribacter sp.]